MTRADVNALYYISHIDNIVEICEKGILSHNKAKAAKPKSIADPVVQERREKVVVPGSNRKLHDYVNLYFNPRNPMMFKRKSLHEELCVLCISCNVLDEPGVIITDGNASSSYTRFLTVPWGFVSLEKDLVYAKYWNDDDPIAKARKTWAICAEVLILDVVPPKFVSKIFVSCSQTKEKLASLLKQHAFTFEVSEKPGLFFL